MLAGDDPFPLKSWLKLTHPLLKAARFDTFCLVAPQPLEIEKEVQLHPQNGDKLPKFVVFWTISTIKDEKSAAKFHYIKSLSGKVVCNQLLFELSLIHI